MTAVCEHKKCKKKQSGAVTGWKGVLVSPSSFFNCKQEILKLLDEV
jgi:hypothetical protein